MNVFKLFGSVEIDQGSIKLDFQELQARAEALKEKIAGLGEQAEETGDTLGDDAAGGAKEYGDALNDPIKKTKILSQNMRTVGASLVAGLSGPISIGLATLAQLGKGFQENVAIIRAGTAATGDTLKALTDDYRQVSRLVPQSGKDVATAIADVNTFLGLQDSKLRGMTKTILDLVRVTGSDLQGTIKNSARLFGDWGIETEKQTETLDDMLKVSQTFGITTDRVMGLLVRYGAPLRQLGFSLEESAVMMGRFEKSGVNVELVLGSMRMALGKFAQNGVSDVPAALSEVIKLIEEAGTVGEANAIALEVFGARAGADMAATIREGKLEIESYLEVVRGMDETIEQAGKDTLSFSQEFQRLKKNALAAAAPLGGLLLEALQALIPFIEKTTTDIGETVDRFTKLPKPILVATGALVGIAAAIGPLILWLSTMSAAVVTMTAGWALVAPVLIPLLGPAGLIVAGGVAVGVLAKKVYDLVTAETEVERTSREYASAMETAKTAADELNSSLSREQLLGKLMNLSNGLTGEGKAAFITWAKQAVASGMSASEIIQETFNRLLKNIIETKRAALAAAGEVIASEARAIEKINQTTTAAKIKAKFLGQDSLDSKIASLEQLQSNLEQMKSSGKADTLYKDSIALTEQNINALSGEVTALTAQTKATEEVVAGMDTVNRYEGALTVMQTKLAKAMTDGSSAEKIEALRGSIDSIREQRDASWAKVAESIEGSEDLSGPLKELAGEISKGQDGLAAMESALERGESSGFFKQLEESAGVVGVLNEVAGAATFVDGELDKLFGDGGDSGSSGGKPTKQAIALDAAVVKARESVVSLGEAVQGSFDGESNLADVYTEYVRTEQALKSLEQAYSDSTLEGAAKENAEAQLKGLRVAQAGLKEQETLLANFAKSEYEINNLSAQDYLKILEIKKSGMERYTNEYASISKEIKAIQESETARLDDINTKNQASMQEGLRQARAKADEMREINRSAQDYMYQEGDMGSDAYIMLLERRKNSYEEYTSEWIAISNQIQRVKDDVEAKDVEGVRKEQALLDTKYRLNAVDVDSYIAQITAKRDAYTEYTDEWINLNDKLLQAQQDKSAADLDEVAKAQALMDIKYRLGATDVEDYISQITTKRDAYKQYTEQWITLNDKLIQAERDKATSEETAAKDAERKADFLYATEATTVENYLASLQEKLRGQEAYTEEWYNLTNKIAGAEKKQEDDRQAQEDLRRAGLDYKYANDKSYTEAYLAELQTRLAQEVEHTSQWLAIQNQIEQVNKDKADTAKELIKAEQVKQDYLFDIEETGKEEYKAILQERLKAHKEYTSEWIAVSGEIRQVQESIDADAKELAQREVNRLDYLFKRNDMSKDTYLGILRERRDAFEQYSSDYLAIQNQIDAINDATEKELQAQQTARLERNKKEIDAAVKLREAQVEAQKQARQNYSDYQYEQGNVSDDDRIALLRRRMKEEDAWSDAWIAILKDINSIEEENDNEREARADANMKRLAEQLKASQEYIETLAKETLSKIQNKQDDAYEQGIVSDRERIETLKQRLKAEEAFTSGYYSVLNDIRAIEQKLEDERNEYAANQLKRIADEARAKKELFDTIAKDAISRIQNMQDDAYDQGSVSDLERIETLKQRMKGEAVWSDAWKTLLNEIRTVEAKIETERTEYANAQIKRITDQVNKTKELLQITASSAKNKIQNAQDDAYEQGIVSDRERIETLRQRLRAEEMFADGYYTVLNEIRAIETKLEDERKARAVAVMTRLAEEAKKAKELAAIRIQDAKTRIQNMQDDAYAQGDVTDQDRIATLQQRLKAEQLFSDGYYSVLNEIRAIEEELADERKQRVKEFVEGVNEQVAKIKEIAQTRLEDAKSRIQNAQDDAFSQNDLSVEEYVDILKQRQTAFGAYTSEWFGIQNRIRAITKKQADEEAKAAKVVIDSKTELATVIQGVQDEIENGVKPATELERKYLDLADQVDELAEKAELTKEEIADLHKILADGKAAESAQANWQKFADETLKPIGTLLVETGELIKVMGTDVSGSVSASAQVAGEMFGVIGNSVASLADDYAKVGNEAFSASNLLGTIGGAAQSSSNIAIKAIGGLMGAMGKFASGDWVGAIISAVTSVITYIYDMFNAAAKRAKEAREYNEALYKLQVEQGKISQEVHVEYLRAKLAASKKGSQEEIALMREVWQAEKAMAQKRRDEQTALIEYRKATGQDTVQLERDMLNEQLHDVNTTTAERYRILTQIHEFEKSLIQEKMQLEEDRVAFAIEKGEQNEAAMLAFIDKRLATAKEGSREELDLLRERFAIEQSLIADQTATVESLMEDYKTKAVAGQGQFVVRELNNIQDLYYRLQVAAQEGNTELINILTVELNNTQERLMRFGESFQAATGFLGSSFETGLYNGIVGMDFSGARESLDVQFTEYITKQIIKMAIEVSGVTELLAEQMANIGEKIRAALASNDWSGVTAEIKSIRSRILNQFSKMMVELAPILPRSVGSLKPLRQLHFPDLYKPKPVKAPTPTTTRKSGGTQISEITGDSRKALEDMLRPLVNLNSIPLGLDRLATILTDGTATVRMSGGPMPSAVNGGALLVGNINPVQQVQSVDGSGDGGRSGVTLRIENVNLNGPISNIRDIQEQLADLAYQEGLGLTGA